jgi:hypothetical protein
MDTPSWYGFSKKGSSMLTKLWNILRGKKQFILAAVLAGWIAYCEAAGLANEVRDIGCYIIAGLMAGNKAVTIARGE